MTSTSTPAYALKVALETAAAAAIEAAEPGAAVTFDWGIPDTWSDDNVLIRRVAGEQTAGPMTGTQRVRDETLDCDLHVVTSRTTQREADERAFDLLGYIERHVRMVDPTLGGVAMWCFLATHEALGTTDEDDLPLGRGCEIIATFTARVRISG